MSKQGRGRKSRFKPKTIGFNPLERLPDTGAGAKPKSRGPETELRAQAREMLAPPPSGLVAAFRRWLARIFSA